MLKEEAILLCRQLMHRYVLVQMSDGAVHDGFVEHVDDEHLYLAVPVCEMEMEANRAFPPYYGYPYGYPFYGYPRRRFYRRALPLAALLALSLLPYY